MSTNRLSTGPQRTSVIQERMIHPSKTLTPRSKALPWLQIVNIKTQTYAVSTIN